MPYSLFLKKRKKLKLSSAANCRWSFKGSNIFSLFQIMSLCPNATMNSNVTQTEQEMSHEAKMAAMIGYYTMDIGVPLVCGFGMLGNVLNLTVLTREKFKHSLSKMENSAHIGLIALAVSDFMFCLLAFLYTQLDFKPPYTELSFVLYYKWLAPSFITVFIITSTWLTVSMAAERYVAVCHPFKARKLIALRKTRITVCLIYFLCICATVPLGFERIVVSENCVDGLILYAIDNRPEFSDKIIGIRRLVWAILFDFIPCVALLYFNTCLIYKIHRAKIIRRTMAPVQKQGALLTKHPRELFSYASHTGSSGSTQTVLNHNSVGKNHRSSRHSLPPSQHHNYQKQCPQRMSKSMKAKRRHTENALNSVTATLVAVVVMFLIFVSPCEIMKYIFLWSGGTETHTYSIIRSITNLMQAINFSVNFILYCVVNKSFRASLRKIFCVCKEGNRRFKLPSFDKALYCHTMELPESNS